MQAILPVLPDPHHMQIQRGQLTECTAKKDQNNIFIYFPAYKVKAVNNVHAALYIREVRIFTKRSIACHFTCFDEYILTNFSIRALRSTR